MIRKEKDEFTFYLNKQQKEAVDSNLRELAGNFNSRRFMYYYILTLINVNIEFGKCDECFISSRSLKKYFHQDTLIKEIKDNLEIWGIIKKTKNHSFNAVTGKAQAPAYIIQPEYKGKLNANITIKIGDKDAKFIQKVIKGKNDKIRTYGKLQSDILSNLYRLTIDAPEAIINSSVNLHRISNEDYNVSPSKYGRITTEICGVEGDYRKYLKFDGQNIIEVDVANSQPLLSIVVFKDYYKKLNQDFPTDLLYMIKQCESGLFYNEIMDELNIPADARREFKDNFFELFFASNYGKKSDVYPVFKKLYPNIADALFNIKKGDYKKFAQELQRIESSIIFSVLTKLYAKDINALTIHDSIVVSNTDDAMLAQKLLADEFYLTHNLTPKLKITEYKSLNEVKKETQYIHNLENDYLEIAKHELSVCIFNYNKFKKDVTDFNLTMKKNLIDTLFEEKEGSHLFNFDNKVLNFTIMHDPSLNLKVAYYDK